MRDPTVHRWLDLCRRAGAQDDPAIRAALDDIVARYAEPQRHYHTSEHVLEVLQTIRGLADPALPARDTELDEAGYQAVSFAGWLHDVIYDPAAPTNEEDSAAYAEERLPTLGVDPSVVAETARLILLTKAHTPANEDRNGMVLLDADLAILAARPKRYDRYAAAVRAEYAHVDDESYRIGRAAVLTSFLERGSLYSCELMVIRCDAPARANLQRELDSLT